MHGAAQAFGHARAIGVAKSVSFKKKSNMLGLKLVFKIVLKLKKNSPLPAVPTPARTWDYSEADTNRSEEPKLPTIK